MKDTAWAAGFEVSHTLLLSSVLKMALLLNPIIPVYLPISFTVDWYRFLRLWKSRLLLVWQLANWGKDALSEAVWSEKQRVLLDLSSSGTGVVIAELDIPVDRSKPIELNIYNDGRNTEFKGCDHLATFDCLVNSLRTMGVHHWKLQWMHDSYEINRWFYSADKEALPVQLALKAGIENRSNPSDIPLGCQQEIDCPGLYVAEGVTSDDVILQAAHRGRTEIVRTLIPGRSQGALHLALNKAHHSGYQQTRDLIFDHLEADVINQMLKPGIFKDRLIHALESDQTTRIKELIDMAPPEVKDLVPALLLRHSREQSKDGIASYVVSRTSENPEAFVHSVADEKC